MPAGHCWAPKATWGGGKRSILAVGVSAVGAERPSTLRTREAHLLTAPNDKPVYRDPKRTSQQERKTRVGLRPPDGVPKCVARLAPCLSDAFILKVPSSRHPFAAVLVWCGVSDPTGRVASFTLGSIAAPPSHLVARSFPQSVRRLRPSSARSSRVSLLRSSAGLPRPTCLAASARGRGWSGALQPWASRRRRQTAIRGARPHLTRGDSMAAQGESACRALAVSDDGKLVALGGTRGRIGLLFLAENRYSLLFRPGVESIASLAFLPVSALPSARRASSAQFATCPCCVAQGAQSTRLRSCRPSCSICEGRTLFRSSSPSQTRGSTPGCASLPSERTSALPRFLRTAADPEEKPCLPRRLASSASPPHLCTASCSRRAPQSRGFHAASLNDGSPLAGAPRYCSRPSPYEGLQTQRPLSALSASPLVSPRRPALTTPFGLAAALPLGGACSCTSATMRPPRASSPSPDHEAAQRSTSASPRAGGPRGLPVSFVSLQRPLRGEVGAEGARRPPASPARDLPGPHTARAPAAPPDKEGRRPLARPLASARFTCSSLFPHGEPPLRHIRSRCVSLEKTGSSGGCSPRLPLDCLTAASPAGRGACARRFFRSFKPFSTAWATCKETDRGEQGLAPQTMERRVGRRSESLLAAAAGRTIQLFDLNTLRRVFEARRHQMPVSHIRLLKKRRTFASLSPDLLLVWNYARLDDVQIALSLHPAAPSLFSQIAPFPSAPAFDGFILLQKEGCITLWVSERRLPADAPASIPSAPQALQKAQPRTTSGECRLPSAEGEGARQTAKLRVHPGPFRPLGQWAAAPRPASCLALSQPGAPLGDALLPERIHFTAVVVAHQRLVALGLCLRTHKGVIYAFPLSSSAASSASDSLRPQAKGASLLSPPPDAGPSASACLRPGRGPLRLLPETGTRPLSRLSSSNSSRNSCALPSHSPPPSPPSSVPAAFSRKSDKGLRQQAPSCGLAAECCKLSARRVMGSNGETSDEGSACGLARAGGDTGAVGRVGSCAAEARRQAEASRRQTSLRSILVAETSSPVLQATALELRDQAWGDEDEFRGSTATAKGSRDPKRAPTGLGMVLEEGVFAVVDLESLEELVRIEDEGRAVVQAETDSKNKFLFLLFSDGSTVMFDFFETLRLSTRQRQARTQRGGCLSLLYPVLPSCPSSLTLPSCLQALAGAHACRPQTVRVGSASGCCLPILDVDDDEVSDRASPCSATESSVLIEGSPCVTQAWSNGASARRAGGSRRTRADALREEDFHPPNGFASYLERDFASLEGSESEPRAVGSGVLPRRSLPRAQRERPVAEGQTAASREMSRGWARREAASAEACGDSPSRLPLQLRGQRHHPSRGFLSSPAGAGESEGGQTLRGRGEAKKHSFSTVSGSSCSAALSAECRREAASGALLEVARPPRELGSGDDPIGAGMKPRAVPMPGAECFPAFFPPPPPPMCLSRLLLPSGYIPGRVPGGLCESESSSPSSSGASFLSEDLSPGGLLGPAELCRGRSAAASSVAESLSGLFGVDANREGVGITSSPGEDADATTAVPLVFSPPNCSPPWSPAAGGFEKNGPLGLPEAEAGTRVC
ncbi:hypothetical protein BESB_007680 [Besnoitia besnoiti]|uniref:Uncharacterized protein n=1 Tax=Besnoitia besnoiti TaxID=94643 RepID=A0A2A9MPV4_BESBE|nr:hypothetical protein BESB_007680 [Besnoitia besnoiti]PFH38426.1 hypothetical protein BESB_007680 [Besnoitia besnoiti]